MVSESSYCLCGQIIVDGLTFAVPQIQQEVVMSNFDSRLHEACAVNSNVPRFGKGQQTYIARELGCSQEAVRKWFAGESIPRAKMGYKLSKLLDVDYTWLVMGAAHGEVDDEIRKAKTHDAAIYATVAYSILRNVGVAFCGDEHSSDLLIIVDGVSRNVCAKLGHPTKDKDVFTATFRKIQIKESTTVVVLDEITKDFVVKTIFLEIPNELWQGDGAKANGNEVTLTLTRKGNAVYGANGIKLHNFLR